MKPLKPWENVYIFISSTFNDMHAERDYLVKRVFPELSEWCEERRLRLVDIDLRWGVTEKDSMENKRVVEVCLKNIDRCRPLFLCFLGQRRGWVPHREDISDCTFENYPKLNSHLGSSVTEMEVTHALIDPMLNGSVLELQNRERAFFFLRDADYLNSITDQEIRNVYTNEGEPEPALADAKLEELKTRVKDTNRPVLNYSAAWNTSVCTPELLTPGKPESIQRGRLTDFRCDDRELSAVVIEQLKKAITELYPDREPAQNQDPLQHELDEQARFLQFAQEGFIERAGDFDEIDRFIAGDDVRPCAIVAPAGMGKTSYLARLADRLQSAGERNVLYRFIGISQGSVSQSSLLLSIASELSSRFGVKNVPSSPQKLKEVLASLLEQAAQQKPLVVLIDAVNQLDTSLEDLSWIPAMLPSNVKFLYSFKLGEPDGDTLHQKLLDEADTYIIQLKGFRNTEDRRALVNQYLSLYLKELDDHHIQDIITSEGAGNPLFLKVLLSELRMFGSHEGLHERINGQFGKTPQTAFTGMLERLENDPVYSSIPPRELAVNLFGWLSHSKNGLEPGELAGLLLHFGFAQTETDALDSVSLMLRQLRAFLAKRDKRQDFFYESFLLAARERYTAPGHGGKSDAQWHRELAEYFVSLDDDDPRKTFELAYQYAHAGMRNELVGLLTSFAYLDRCIRLFGVQTLIQDFDLSTLPEAGVSATDGRQLALICEALQMGASVISMSRSQLPIQLFGRLMGFELPLIRALLNDTENTLRERKVPWLKPLCTQLPQPGGRILRYYNTIRTGGAQVFSDKKRMAVYCTDDKSVKIVEIASGRVLRSVSFRAMGELNWIHLCEDANVLAVRTFYKLHLLNLKTGKIQDAEGVSDYGYGPVAAHKNWIVCTGSKWRGCEETFYLSDVHTGKLLDRMEYKTGHSRDGFRNTATAAFDKETDLLYLSTNDTGFFACDPRQGFAPSRRLRNPHGEMQDTLEAGQQYKSSASYLPEGTPFFVTCTAYDGLTVYDKTTGDVLIHRSSARSFGAYIAISPDKKTLAYSSYNWVDLISLDPQAGSADAPFTIGTLQNEIRHLSFSPDGKKLYLGRANGAIELFDLQEKRVVDTYIGIKDPIFGLNLDTQANTMVAEHEGRIIVWKKEGVDQLPPTPVFDIQANSVAMAPDGSFAIATTVSSDGAIYRIELPSMQCRVLVESAHSFFNWDHVTISSDGRFFGAVVHSERMEFFDCVTGEKIGEFTQVDTRKEGDDSFIQIWEPRLLPAAFSIGPRNLTVMYMQNGCLILQDPDAPGKERVINAVQREIQHIVPLEDGKKLAVFYNSTMTDSKKLAEFSAGAQDLRAVRIFDTVTGEQTECADDWIPTYLQAEKLQNYPELPDLLRKKIRNANYFIRPFYILCRQPDRLLYHRDLLYFESVGESLGRNPFVVWDSTREKPLCWYVNERGFSFNTPLVSPDGRYALFKIWDSLYAFSIKNLPEPEQWRVPEKTESELDHLGLELFQKGDPENMFRAYLVYSELVRRVPEKEHHQKNRGIMERNLKREMDRMCEEEDMEALKRCCGRYGKLFEGQTQDESYRALYGYARGKVAYLLSQHDDLASKEQAKAIYAELVQIGHDAERSSNNLRITRAQIAAIHLKRAEAGDREAAQIAYSLYSELAKDYPDHKYAGNAAYVKNQFLQ